MRRSASFWVVVVLALIEGGWMAYDGVHALRTGDYVTPTSGEHAGELGPWAGVVESLGIEPRSRRMMWIFALTGAGWLITALLFAFGLATRRMMLLFALATLWYLPVGSILSAIQAMLLFGMRPRPEPPPD